MNSQEKIWAHFQNAAVDSFAGAIPRLNYLLKRIQKLLKGRKASVLNIGIGNGYLEEEVLARGWESYSLDPDQNAVSQLLSKGIHAKVGRIENIPFDDQMFDAVVASEVLEHLTDNELSPGLAEIFRVLKRGGHFISTVPYRENLSDNEVVCPDCGKIFHRWGHHQSFDERSFGVRISGLFGDGAFDVKYFVDWKSLNFKGKLTAAVKLLLVALGIHGSNESLVFLGRKP